MLRRMAHENGQRVTESAAKTASQDGSKRQPVIRESSSKRQPVIRESSCARYGVRTLYRPAESPVLGRRWPYVRARWRTGLTTTSARASDQRDHREPIHGPCV